MNKKSKEEIMREREINKSFVILSKAARLSLGVYAYQEEKKIFFLGEKRYVKIYALKSLLKTEHKKEEFLKLLGKITSNRIRISVSCKDMKNPDIFITVFHKADSHLAIISEIDKFDTIFIRDVCKPLNLKISECDIYDVLSCIDVNFNSKIRNMKELKVLDPKADWTQIFPEFSDSGKGHFKFNEVVGNSYLARNFPDKKISVDKIYRENLYICIDFQSFTQADYEILGYELENKYNTKLKFSETSVFNLTYMLVVLGNSQEEVAKMESELRNFFESNGILLFPGAGRERDICYSSFTLGLIDFHSMQNVNECVVSSLLL